MHYTLRWKTPSLQRCCYSNLSVGSKWPSLDRFHLEICSEQCGQNWIWVWLPCWLALRMWFNTVQIKLNYWFTDWLMWKKRLHFLANEESVLSMSERHPRKKRTLKENENRPNYQQEERGYMCVVSWGWRCQRCVSHLSLWDESALCLHSSKSRFQMSLTLRVKNQLHQTTNHPSPPSLQLNAPLIKNMQSFTPTTWMTEFRSCYYCGCFFFPF